MKKYFEHMQQKSTHERRQHAVQIASVVTALVFVGWLGTLGVRLTTTPNSATQAGDSQQTQLANIVSGTYTPQGNTLEVATTSVQY